MERPFFAGLGAASGTPLAVNYNPLDVLGIQAADSLRLLRSGAFDVMSVQIGMVARDDPFFEGLDLIGVEGRVRGLGACGDQGVDGLVGQDAGAGGVKGHGPSLPRIYGRVVKPKQACGARAAGRAWGHV